MVMDMDKGEIKLRKAIQNHVYPLLSQGSSCFIKEIGDNYVIVSDVCPNPDCKVEGRRTEESLYIKLTFDEDDMIWDDAYNEIKKIVGNQKHPNISVGLELSCCIGDIIGWLSDKTKSK